MKISLLTIILIGVLLVGVGQSQASDITFAPPTLANDSTTNNNYIIVNASITTTNLSSMIWNWNGTNITLLNDSCVLHLSFDNNSAIGDSSTLAIDVSQQGNNGSFTNGSTGNWTTDGKHNGAMSFDGINDCIACGADASLNRTSNMTIEAWVNPADIGSDMRIVFGGDAYTLWIRNDGVFRFADTWGNNIITTDTASVDTWYHIVGVFTGQHGDALTTDNIFIYVNGESKGVTTEGSWNASGLETLYIGKKNVQNYFNGTIDEIRIYDRALSHDEINQSYLSNLYKFNSSMWYFYSNQTSLSYGEYNYQLFANSVKSDYRVVTVSDIDTTPLDNKIPLSIFIMWSVVMFAGVLIGFMSTGLIGIISSLLTITIAYMNAKNIINGNVVQYFGGISSTDTIVIGYRTIESLPLSYIYLFVAIVMLIVFLLHVKNEIMYQIQPDTGDIDYE